MGEEGSGETGRRMDGLKEELDPQGEPEPIAEECEEEIPDRAREIEEPSRKNEENLDKLKRLQADFDNYRKRAQKERDEITQLATARLVKELLQLSDNFERALSNPGSLNGEAQLQGLKMMYDQLTDILRSEGVTEIDTDCKLDPFQHEVMTKVDDPNHADDEIVECVQKGYRMKGKVIRPARVIVCRRETVEDDDQDDSCREENGNDEREVN